MAMLHAVDTAADPCAASAPFRPAAAAAGSSVLAMAALPLSCCCCSAWRLGFFDGKFLAGFGKLGEIAAPMLPPNPGDWCMFASF